MNRNQFAQHTSKLVDSCIALLDTKGEDYSYADEDRLSNFKDAAKEIGLTKYQVWYVYFNKGMSAVRRYISKGKIESENIHARIQDAINYLILLDAVITEDESPEAECKFTFTPALTPYEPIKSLKGDTPGKSPLPIPLKAKYCDNQEVTKQGIRCVVNYCRMDGLRWFYDLQAIESGNIFRNVPEEEIKPCGIKPKPHIS